MIVVLSISLLGMVLIWPPTESENPVRVAFAYTAYLFIIAMLLVAIGFELGWFRGLR